VSLFSICIKKQQCTFELEAEVHQKKAEVKSLSTPQESITMKMKAKYGLSMSES